ncbi:hypothetical protein ACU8KH_00478 [Lachancea thermotolerans]
MRLALGLRIYNYKYYCIQGSKLIITYDNLHVVSNFRSSGLYFKLAVRWLDNYGYPSQESLFLFLLFNLMLGLEPSSAYIYRSGCLSQASLSLAKFLRCLRTSL